MEPPSRERSKDIGLQFPGLPGNEEWIDDQKVRNAIGTVYGRASFFGGHLVDHKGSGEHSGMVRRASLLAELHRRGMFEHGAVQFENLRSFRRCRAGIERIADECLKSDGPLQSIAWKGGEGVMGNVEFQQQRRCGKGPVSSLEELYEVAKQALPVFEAIILGMAREIGALNAVSVAPLKGEQRAQAKADNEYNKMPPPAVSWLFDIVRGCCIFETEDEIVNFFQKLVADGRVEIVRVKNRFNPPEFNGYRDMLLNLRVEASPGVRHMCELQIHHKQIKTSDLIHQSHITYEYFRNYFVGNKEAVAKRLDALEGLPVDEVECIDALVNLVLERETEAEQLYQLVDLLNMMSQFELAGQVRRRLVELRGTEEGSKETAEYATELNNLAQLLSAQGKLDEAEAPMKQALAIFRKVLGEEHPNVATLLNNLAQLLQARGKLDEAEPLYKQSLAIDKKVYGEDHPEVATDLNNLAGFLSDQGKFDEAKPNCEQAIVIWKKVHGEEHPSVASGLNNLAQLLQAQGKLDEAVPLTTQSLAIRKRVYGEEHPAVATALNNLARLLKEQGKLDEAEQHCTRAVAIMKKAHGAGHRYVLVCEGTLGTIRMKRGDGTEVGRMEVERVVAALTAPPPQPSTVAHLCGEIHQGALCSLR